MLFAFFAVIQAISNRKERKENTLRSPHKPRLHQQATL